ncbi:pentapeptide repeat-containing protein [Streptomyces sp. NPDC050273]|uniref:pentapeptide repeat-containing protein n=1 Tax=Streptomyces sp. NPDC050273 TaxID=3154933 RepID=UPI003428EC2C
MLAAAGDKHLETLLPGTFTKPSRPPILPPAGPTDTPEPTRLTLPPRAPLAPTRLDQRDRGSHRAQLEESGQAVLTVGRRPLLDEPFRIDPRRRDLCGADLQNARLERVRLAGAHLEGAALIGAHLEQAWLKEVHLNRAWLDRAHLEGAHLRGPIYATPASRRPHLEPIYSKRICRPQSA